MNCNVKFFEFCLEYFFSIKQLWMKPDEKFDKEFEFIISQLPENAEYVKTGISNAEWLWSHR